MARTLKLRYLGEPVCEIKEVKSEKAKKADMLSQKPYLQITLEEKAFLDEFRVSDAPKFTRIKTYVMNGDGTVKRKFPVDKNGELTRKWALSRISFNPPNYVAEVNENDYDLLKGNSFGTPYAIYEPVEEKVAAAELGSLDLSRLQEQLLAQKNEIQALKMRLGRKQKREEQHDLGGVT